MAISRRDSLRFGSVAACIALAGLTACEDPAARREREAIAARSRVAAESLRANTATAAPSTGLWTEAQLTKRLVDAGLAPQRRDSVRAQPFMGAPVIAYQVGNGKLDAYIYRDSLARKSAVAKLDAQTLAPAGQTSPYAVPHELIQNNNLAVIVVGTDRQRDRVGTALAAGLGAP